MAESAHESSFSVAIVGGGIAGLTLALALLRREVPFKIYEQASKFGEIGAGVAFGPNAIKAMEHCDIGILRAFETVVTHNQWPSKEKVYFDWVDGFNRQEGTDEEKYLFTLENELGASSVHRAAFLDEIVKLIPEEVCHFGKRLGRVVELQDGIMKLNFEDGTTATADAVIACDGIKSRARQLMYGEDSPISYPHYTHQYAYRGLIPMDKAVKALGEDTALNGKMHLGPDGHVLTFPIKGGSVLNVVAFRNNKDPWPDATKLTMPATKAKALQEFDGWGYKVISIINMLEDNLDCWAIFDTLDHPVPSFFKDRLLLCGDAAHATSPHHGSGAGMCCEDAAILADLLSEVSSRNLQSRNRVHNALRAAFEAFDENRRERTQWLVKSSRFTGELFQWRAQGVGSDIEKIRLELVERHRKIWEMDVVSEAKAAVASFKER